MKVIETSLPGVLIVEPDVFEDERGFFMETFHQGRFRDLGLPTGFVQDNHSFSKRGVLRGLHYQEPNPQGKLVRAVTGTIFDVAVDIRRGSSHYGRWFGAELSEENRRQLWIPPGLAHGFCVLAETANVIYKCTALYDREGDRSIRWDDPDIGIEWPVDDPIVSAKDAAAPLLRDASILPAHGGS
ncbi:MAG TPA: dTDP-4-dehydrorhamnose 3,5-epimerase [Thermoanaerobaculia bacterium]|nr:dTDP-4-dehydrorhamnose 3,5-epimerase [Thermoanaerobaculia bacterium]